MHIVILNERLDTAAAQSLFDELTVCSGNYIIDASAVQHISGKCLKTLLFFFEKSKIEKREFSLLNPSNFLIDILNYLNLSHKLL